MSAMGSYKFEKNENFKSFGAIEERYKEYVRPRLEEEK